MKRASAITLALTLAAYAVLAYGYLTRTPVWQNPDEPAHYNYVAFVAQTGGLPTLQAGDWDSALLERLKTGRLQPGDAIGSIRYESWQPPLFYLVAAPVFRLGPTTDPSTTVFRLRALNAVFGAVTLLLAYAIARQVFDPMLATAVPLAMVGVPMFTSVSASLSADPLANLLAAAILLALLQRQSPIWLGVLLGLGLLTKLELAIFIPLAVAVLRRVRELAVALVMAAVAVAPWLVHQVTSYGWADPLATARHAEVVADQPRFPGFTADWLAQFLTVSFHSFWAQFGWMAIVAPTRLYWIWGALTLLAVLGLISHRAWLSNPTWRLMLVTVAIAFVAYVGYNLAFEQFQSRYLFTAIVPIATLLVAGWRNLLPARTQPWSALALPAALVALNAYALTRVLVPGFAPAA